MVKGFPEACSSLNKSFGAVWACVIMPTLVGPYWTKEHASRAKMTPWESPWHPNRPTLNPNKTDKAPKPQALKPPKPWS